MSQPAPISLRCRQTNKTAQATNLAATFGAQPFSAPRISPLDRKASRTNISGQD
jgi:hypothetical protein